MADKLPARCPRSSQPYDPELIYFEGRRAICDLDGECHREFPTDPSGLYPEHLRLVYDAATDNLVDAVDAP